MPHRPLIPLRFSVLRLGLGLAAACFVAAVVFQPEYAAASRKKEAPPAKPATQYAAFDTHPKEHVTIAADPCDKPANCSFFRLEYIQHGFLPVRVIVTNDGDQPISLDDARIQFISAKDEVIPAATDDDLNRRLFSTRSVHGTRIPLPAPLPPITIHHAPVDKKITEDDNDFGFPGTLVKPHSTLSGYLFYDIRPLDDPAMKDAELYVKEVRTAAAPTSDAKQPDAKQPVGAQLFAFSIPFNKWLASHEATKDSSQKASQ